MTVRIEYTTVHLPDILHDLRTIIQGFVHSKQQDLYIDTQDVIHEDIITDKLRLTQVLLNICSNAVKFTPVGGMINIRVSEKSCRRDGYITVVFSVKDNGIGMSREFRKHVFDSFSREHTVTGERDRRNRPRNGDHQKHRGHDGRHDPVLKAKPEKERNLQLCWNARSSRRDRETGTSSGAERRQSACGG